MATTTNCHKLNSLYPRTVLLIGVCFLIFSAICVSYVVFFVIINGQYLKNSLMVMLNGTSDFRLYSCVLCVFHTAEMCTFDMLLTYLLYSLVCLFVWSPAPHIPYISSPNQCLLFAAHAHTIATCFTVVWTTSYGPLQAKVNERWVSGFVECVINSPQMQKAFIFAFKIVYDDVCHIALQLLTPLNAAK